jgi:hypothetical protein
LEWFIRELVTLAMLVYAFLQLIMALRYRGRWLLLSLVPLVVMIPLAVHAGLALAEGSSLWAVPLILAAPVAFLYLLGLAVAKAVMA